MLTNHLDEAANDASWALLELKNSSAKLPSNLEPVSVVTALPRVLHSSTTVADGDRARSSTAEVNGRDANANGQAELACFDLGIEKYVVRKELVQIGRNSSKGDVDIDVTRVDGTATGFVSRIHCEVRHNPRTRKFYLSCFGKNGVFVDDKFQRKGDEPLQLPASCVLTFPSTRINLRFMSLIPDVDQTSLKCGEFLTYANGGTSTMKCERTAVEPKGRNGLKVANGQVCASGYQVEGASVNGHCASLHGNACERVVHIPEATLSQFSKHCDIPQRTVPGNSPLHSSECYASSVKQSTHDNGNSGAQTSQLVAVNGLSCFAPAQPLLSTAKSDTCNQQCPADSSASAVFRQPVNGCCANARPVGCSAPPNASSLSMANGNANATSSDCLNRLANGHSLTESENAVGAESGNADRGPKPPYSYAQLIAQAIANSPQRQLTLSGIYAFITKNYPYFHANDKGWQNSIRHNLSLNRFFMKVPRSHEEPGKGMFWRIEAEYEQKLIATAFRKRRQRSSAASVPDAAAVSRRCSRPNKARLSNANVNVNVNLSAPDLGLDSSNSNSNPSATLPRTAPTSPCELGNNNNKSPHAFTATLTASGSASSDCSSRNTSPTCENELLGVVRPFALPPDGAVFPLQVSKSISLPHSPVTTFFIDEVRQRCMDSLLHAAENDSFAPLRKTASARSTPAFPIAKQSPLTLPRFTEQQQHLALYIPSGAQRSCTQSNTLTPPNSASSNCRGSSCASELSNNSSSSSKCDAFGFPNGAKHDVPVTPCGAQPAVLIESHSQLHSYLQQQSGSMGANNAAGLTRQYSMPATASNLLQSDSSLLRSVTLGKRPMETLNVANNSDCHSQLLPTSRANGHAVPLKKRCHFKLQLQQDGQE